MGQSLPQRVRGDKRISRLCERIQSEAGKRRAVTARPCLARCKPSWSPWGWDSRTGNRERKALPPRPRMRYPGDPVADSLWRIPASSECLDTSAPAPEHPGTPSRSPGAFPQKRSGKNRNRGMHGPFPVVIVANRIRSPVPPCNFSRLAARHRCASSLTRQPGSPILKIKVEGALSPAVVSSLNGQAYVKSAVCLSLPESGGFVSCPYSLRAGVPCRDCGWREK